jgi:tetratricopeptide (TPR) repeat protein
MSLLMKALKKAEEAKKNYQSEGTIPNSSNNSIPPTNGDDRRFFPENKDQQTNSQSQESDDLLLKMDAIIPSDNSSVSSPTETFQPTWNRDYLKELEVEDDDPSLTITTLNVDDPPSVSVKDWESRLRPEFKDSDMKEEVIPFYEEGLHHPVDALKVVDDLERSNQEEVEVKEPTKSLSKVLEAPNQVKAFSLRDWQQEQSHLQPDAVATVTEDDNPFGPSAIELGLHTAKSGDKKVNTPSIKKDFAEHTLPPEPATAQRILAAGAPPSAYHTKIGYALLGVVFLGMGIGTYYYSDLRFLFDSQSSSNRLYDKKRTTAVPTPSPPAVNPEKVAQEVTKAPTANQAPKSPEPPPLVPQEQPKPPDPVASETSPLLTANPNSTLATAQAVEAKVKQQETELKTASKLAEPVKPDQGSKPKENSPKETSKSSTEGKATSEKPTAQNDKQKEIQLRKTLTQKINTEVSSGYAAFQRGDEKTAERAYRQALQQDQNNRDALLGLAAVAMRRGDIHAAQQYYRRVLTLYPQETYAQVGLINTLDTRSLESESQLKLLLEKAPQSAYIHFSLGNLYANQGRWAQAQQAYFDAYRYDSKKADYAYNLAVSLDQLNQSAAALNYYQIALQLARTQAVSFNSKAIQHRVQTLLNHAQTKVLSTSQ